MEAAQARQRLHLLKYHIVGNHMSRFKFTDPSAGMPNCSRGYKTFPMLNSAEHEIYPAHKC